MSSFNGNTLEEFLEDQCGVITPKLLEVFEPHRQFVETALEQYNKENHSWKTFSNRLWIYLPDPQDKRLK